MTRKPKINNKLINLTFYFFFDAVIQEERPRTHLLTTTDGREGLQPPYFCRITNDLD